MVNTQSTQASVVISEDLWDKFAPLQYTLCTFEESVEEETVIEVIVEAIRDTFNKNALVPPHVVGAPKTDPLE